LLARYTHCCARQTPWRAYCLSSSEAWANPSHYLNNKPNKRVMP
jgi:hypothetical protein